MKKVLNIFLFLCFSSSFAQYDLAQFENATVNTTIHPDINTEPGIYFSGDIVPGNINNLVFGDTMYLPYTVGAIAEHSGIDTLKLDISVKGWNHLSTPSFTFSNRQNTYTFTDVPVRTNSTGTFSLIEGEVDTLKVVVLSGSLQLDAITIHTGGEIILDPSKGLQSNEVTVSNPVEEGVLTIDLNGYHTELELISMQGEVVKSFVVEGNDQISVSDLTAGVYILRDKQTASFRKIMIK